MHSVLNEIQSHCDPQKAKDLARFFKTGKGEYGEGDRFLGIIVPKQRIIARQYWKQLTLNDVEELLHNRFHECRMIALFILVLQYKKASEAVKGEIVRLYLRNTAYINNWDLVDLSSRDIVGAYFFDKDRSPLYRLARSPLLWDRRIAIIATFYFIARNDFEDSFKIAEILLPDRHDLIHKAIGWVIREIGKRNLQSEEDFIRKHYADMPRTALRYAIERFPEAKRRSWLKGTFS